ncbi:MAG: ribbon-helix-helix protein, CopG family [Bryobacterales bacterium]|nr:ribbon-helix-helix protein, CopG family [Bryobacterales bacterium]
MTAVSLSLPDEVAQRLQRLSQRTGRTRTFFILEAIRQHLDDLEDLHLAEQRLIDLRARRSRVVPLEDVMERYGMQHRA